MLAANSVHIINDYVFSHKSSTLPPSFTLKGGSQRGHKDETLDCIVPADPAHAVMTAAMLDGTVLTSIFRPEGAATFVMQYERRLPGAYHGIIICNVYEYI